MKLGGLPLAGTSNTPEVDVSTTGKQAAHLRVPHSVRRSAHEWLPAPITGINNGEGPTLFIMAGNHRDEYEGRIAVSTLARLLDATDLRGRSISLPTGNAPAAEAGLRASPIDGGNLNRLFPGSASGTPTDKTAHHAEDGPMPLADHAVDLHSGGRSLFCPPTVRRGQGHSPEETKARVGLQEPFDLPDAGGVPSGGRGPSTARTAMGAANSNGVGSVKAEFGGSGVVTPGSPHRTDRGSRRVPHISGMLPDDRPGAAPGTRELNAQGAVHALAAGPFGPLRSLGDDLEVGESAGLVDRPDMPGSEPTEIPSPHAGIALRKRAMAQVVQGDAVFQIASDDERKATKT